jgi:hypothetical protein
MYYKLLKNGGWELKGKGEQWKGLNRPKQSRFIEGTH